MERSTEKLEKNHVRDMFANQSEQLHNKVDATRDAYYGFIFPVNRGDFKAVADAFELSSETARELYASARRFSSFRLGGKTGQVTNHIVGASILALRGKDLDSGLKSVSDESLAEIVSEHSGMVLEIADARASWFGRVYFPSSAFANAIAVFGGTVSAEKMYEVAETYGFSASAGDRRTVRGDFGIAVWLALLAKAP